MRIASQNSGTVSIFLNKQTVYPKRDSGFCKHIISISKESTDPYGYLKVIILTCNYVRHFPLSVTYLQGIQKNTQQFEMHATVERLVEKVKGGTTECENFGSLQASKQRHFRLPTV